MIWSNPSIMTYGDEETYDDISMRGFISKKACAKCIDFKDHRSGLIDLDSSFLFSAANCKEINLFKVDDAYTRRVCAWHLQLDTYIHDALSALLSSPIYSLD
ncbi:hypothetical protein L2E82_26127 [Cichorium intybus]|uniref:Uncharacterized protein n=1 Tax=Cichorium intybus TaxID=13427 RepID=A0ACB9E506_CICIN|nr:hypothetical protein L2E82_26127 [Cichorium intybus]